MGGNFCRDCVKHIDDVRVRADLAGYSSLFQKQIPLALLLSKLRMEQLEGAGFAGSLVGGLVDRGHASSAEIVLDAVAICDGITRIEMELVDLAHCFHHSALVNAQKRLR